MNMATSLPNSVRSDPKVLLRIRQLSGSILTSLKLSRFVFSQIMSWAKKKKKLIRKLKAGRPEFKAKKNILHSLLKTEYTTLRLIFFLTINPKYILIIKFQNLNLTCLKFVCRLSCCTSTPHSYSKTFSAFFLAHENVYFFKLNKRIFKYLLDHIL